MSYYNFFGSFPARITSRGLGRANKKWIFGLKRRVRPGGFSGRTKCSFSERMICKIREAIFDFLFAREKVRFFGKDDMQSSMSDIGFLFACEKVRFFGKLRMQVLGSDIYGCQRAQRLMCQLCRP